MSDDLLHSRMRALAEALDAERPSPDLRRRVLEHAPHHTAATSPRWIPIVAFAAGVLVTWVVLAMRSPSEPSPEHRDDAGLASVGPSRCAASIGATPVAVAEGCRIEIEDLGVVVDVWEPARLSRHGRTLAMPDGAATFEVEPVGDHPAIEVDIGPGRVRVLGTRFEIQNVGDAGHLDLIRGRVDFVVAGAEPRAVAPGERVSWSRTVAVPAAIDPVEATEASPEHEEPIPMSEPRSTKERVSDAQPDGEHGRDPATTDLDATLERVARLRHAGDYVAARELVSTAMHAVTGTHAREVLSFEIGTILELEGDTIAACGHWKKHVERFADGRTIERAKTHRERLGCNDE